MTRPARLHLTCDRAGSTELAVVAPVHRLGVAGVALSQLTNVGPNLGQQYIIDSFMVVVFGGVGQLAGTVYAALGSKVTVVEMTDGLLPGAGL